MNPKIVIGVTDGASQATVGISAEAPKAVVHIRVTSDTDGLATREYVQEAVGKKFDADQGVENAGKLMYVGADGALVPLILGAGLEIRDGVLVATATGAVLTVDADGNATLK